MPAPPRRGGNPHWVKGVSGNPKGRPKTGTAFAEAVRELVDPRELIEIALDIARGRPRVQDLVYLRNAAEAKARGEPPPPIEGVEVKWPSVADSQAALTFLRTSGWQTPTQAIELSRGSDAPMLDYKKLSAAEMDALEESLAKAAGILDVAAREPHELEAPRQDAPKPDPLGIL